MGVVLSGCEVVCGSGWGSHVGGVGAVIWVVAGAVVGRIEAVTWEGLEQYAGSRAGVVTWEGLE